VIFVDTSFFAALLLPKDANHSRAVRAIEALDRRRLSDLLLTTNNVVLETITVARYEGDHRVAVRAGELLYGGAMARLYRTVPTGSRTREPRRQVPPLRERRSAPTAFLERGSPRSTRR
jgi:predicted nucleic acid-binding protein